MRRQKTPQKQDGKAISGPATDVATGALIVTDGAAGAGVNDSVSSPAMPSGASVTVSAAELPLDTASSQVSTASAAALPLIDASSTKPKTPQTQTRKARSRIAANFGALNSPQS